MSYVQHARVVDVHGLLRIGDIVLIIEIDTSIVDQHVNAAVLFDFFCESSDAAVVRNVEFRVQDAARAMRRFETQVLSRASSGEELERRYVWFCCQDALTYGATDAAILTELAGIQESRARRLQSTAPVTMMTLGVAIV